MINFFLISVPNDTNNFSISAGACIQWNHRWYKKYDSAFLLLNAAATAFKVTSGGHGFDAAFSNKKAEIYYYVKQTILNKLNFLKILVFEVNWICYIGIKVETEMAKVVSFTAA